MQTVSTAYHNRSIAKVRKPTQDVLVDWFNKEKFISEKQYTKRIEVQRVLDDPMGGMTIALADVILINKRDRFTPQ